MQDNSKWSLELNNCSISDALKQINKVTGVKVITNQGIDKMVKKKNYKNKSIDHIVTDLLSRENYAIIRHYNKKKLVSIGIWMLDLSNAKGNPRSVASNNPFKVNRTRRKGKSGNTISSFKTERAVKNSTVNNPLTNITTNNSFKTNRTRKNAKSDNKINPFANVTTNNIFKGKLTGKNARSGNVNNPFFTEGQ